MASPKSIIRNELPVGFDFGDTRISRRAAFRLTASDSQSEIGSHRMVAYAPATAVLTLIGVLSLLVGQREFFVSKLPEVAGLYSTIGLSVNNRGMELRNIRPLLAEEDSRRILMVEGQIANTRAATTRIPDLKISVRAEGGREVYHWISPRPKSELSAGETITFRVRLLAAPEEGKEVKVQFAEQNPPATSKALFH